MTAPFQIAPDAALLPCDRCGRPSSARSNGRPLHIACGLAAGIPTPAGPLLAEQQRPTAGALTLDQQQLADQIEHYVTGLLDLHQGDVDAVRAAMEHQPIALVMELFDRTRASGGLTVFKKPPTPPVLQTGADEVWEARPNWPGPGNPRPVPDGAVTLDVNAAYLAAFKCHLPVGELRHVADGTRYPKTAGIHLITPPDWPHTDLPSPLSDREMLGQVWITTATLRTLDRCAIKLGLCALPTIHEQWIAPSSEGLLEPMRVILDHVRLRAKERDDDLTSWLVQQMYGRFVSTCGNSRKNHHIRRPDWEHNLRAQAYTNLWWRAHKAWAAGLTITRVGGTDELGLAGDWRTLWPEGRGLGQFKIKTTKAAQQ